MDYIFRKPPRGKSSRKLKKSSSKLENFNSKFKLNRNRDEILHISLDENSIKVLSPDFFNNLINLEFLSLSGNLLTNLPSSIINLKKIMTIELTYNRFYKLPNILFELKSLSSLVIPGNIITEIPPEVTKLSKLSGLDLSFNFISRLPDEITKIKNLTQLILRGNNLIELPANFNELKSLVKINLSNNFLSSLPTNMEFPELQQFIAFSNRFHDIPESFFNSISLMNLDLSENFIEKFSPSLSALVNIYSFRASLNRLRHFPYFRGNNLEYISLRSNKIRSLPEDFSNIPNLISLELSDNNLEFITEGISSLKKLKRLNLDFNKISSIENLKFLSNLINLSFAVNNINEIPDDFFKNMSKLVKITVSYNPISSLPKSIADIGNLEVLNLGYTNIEAFPDDEFRKLKKITRLHMSSIRKINNFPKFKYLCDLKLAFNQLSEIPDNISVLDNLTSLDISHNRFEIFPEKITYLINLIELDISHNDLKFIPDSIIKLRKLESFNAGFNSNLENITNKLSCMVNLQHFKVPYCRLKKIPNINLSSQSAFCWSQLEGNPIKKKSIMFKDLCSSLKIRNSNDNNECYDTNKYYGTISIAEMQGYRPKMEDTILIKEYLPPKVDKYTFSLIAIFDGHGNSKASEFCAKNFHNIFKSVMLKLLMNPIDCTIPASAIFPNYNSIVLNPNYESLKKLKKVEYSKMHRYYVSKNDLKHNSFALKNGDHWKIGNLENKIGRLEVNSDSCILKSKIVDNMKKDKANIVIEKNICNNDNYCLDNKIPNLLEKKILSENKIHALVVQTLIKSFRYISEKLTHRGLNCGTTCALSLFHENDLWLVSCGDARITICLESGEAFRATVDHKAHLYEERRRIQYSGGVVLQGRVQSRMAISRSLTDNNFSPYVSSIPQVHHMKIEKEKFLIVACDGLWDVMRDQQAVDFVKDYYKKNKTYRGSASMLRDMAYIIGSKDNISIIIVELKGK